MTLHSYKKTWNFKQGTTFFLTLGFLALSFLSSFTHVFAQVGGVADGENLQTSPKIRDSVITATVPDIVDPTAPFLISPEDESLLRDGTPTFVWQESTDNVGVTYYQMYLDGDLLFDNIPIVSTSHADYELVYDSVAGRYSLTPTSTMSDDLHTWNILAYDAAGNNNTSATWSFTIDTLAPSFVITSIGPISTDISAQDIDSVPEDPIELEDNSPEFLGTGEAESTVQVTVSTPGESDQIIEFTIDDDSNWSFELGILPRDEIITLNFIITDLAGNISILTDLKILIIQEYIIIPPTPTPSPSPSPSPEVSPTPTPHPGTSPTPTPLPSFTPIPTPPPTPIIKIPILPPEEIVIKIVKDVVPKPIIDAIAKIPELAQAVIMDTAKAVAPVGVIVATAAIPAISFLSLLMQLGQQFSWQLILKILQALGLLPPKEPQGLVYDSDTNEPVAFALLTITSTNREIEEKIIETVVTDVDGVYQGVQLPVGKYIIDVSHQDYRFPTSKQRPGYLTDREFYLGEVFEVSSSSSQQLFLIPVDKLIETQERKSVKKTIRRILQKIRFTNFFWLLFAISIIITVFYPTIINLVVLGFYVLVLFRKLIRSLRKPSVSGYVRNTNESPVENAIVRITDPAKGDLVALITTNEKGYFSAFLEPNKYQIQISKNGFVWERQGSGLSFEEIDITNERVSVNAVMKDVNEIYEEMFK